MPDIHPKNVKDCSDWNSESDKNTSEVKESLSLKKKKYICEIVEIFLG